MYETVTLPAFTPYGTWYGEKEIEVQYDDEYIVRVWYKGVDIFPIIQHLNAFDSLVKIINHANTHS
jgi:hypothetical protein